MIKEFSYENKFSMLFLVLISVSFGLVQTKGISEISSALIEALQKSDSSKIWNLFYLLVALYAIYQTLYYLFYELKSRLVSKMKPWARYKLLDAVMKVNNDVFSEVNFTKLNSPIHRVADLIASIISDILAFMVPNVIFVLIISSYFLTISPTFACIFLVGNFFNMFYYYFTFSDVLAKNKIYEDKIQKTDGVMIDVLSNLDKIIYRGKTVEESDRFEAIADKNATAGIDYYGTSNMHCTIMLLILLLVFLFSLGYLIKLKLSKQISHVTFLSSLSILVLYREKLAAVTEQLPDFIGYVGRMEVALKYFNHVNIHFEEVFKNNRFTKKNLVFKHIKFENVSYKYTSGKSVFKNQNHDITLSENEIIGITGPSGSGKSTFIKLLIKMYPLNEGKIFIDGVNIKDLDPSYIRDHITYVNQNSKLFDKKVIDNILYGCSDRKKCEYFLDKIMKYPTIANLYKNMDIYTKESGLLGENLSGGQRQIVNMIGGFINPSKILVLDEPTNALDPKLKKEVIGLINDFKTYKQSIFIISHDRDVFPLFDREIKMQIF